MSDQHKKAREMNSQNYPTVKKTRAVGSNEEFMDAVWYDNYYPDGCAGVRFIGKVDIQRSDLFEIEKGKENG